MENFSSELAKSLAATFAVLPGFTTRAAASYFIPPHNEDKGSGILFSAVGTAFFWFLILMLSGKSAHELAQLKEWGRPEALLVLASWGIVFSIDLAARKCGPVLSKWLQDRGVRWRVPTGVRHPWLVSMDWVGESNTVEAWMKNGVVYIGQVFVFPEMTEHDSIMLVVYGVAMSHPDEPHRSTEYFEYPDDEPRQFVVLRREDIAAFKIKDWTTHLKAKETQPKSPVRESESWGSE